MIIDFPFKKRFTDEEIVTILAEGVVEKEDEAIKHLYKHHYRSIQRMILSRGGMKNDVPDIFQDTIIAFYENVKSDKFKLERSIKNYLYIIAQNKWINKQKKNQKITPTENIEQLAEKSAYKNESIDYNWNQYGIIEKIMNRLKPDCRMILQLSIYQKMSMKDIAEHMSFKNSQIARNKKSKCLNYLRNILLQFPEDNLALIALLERG